MPVVAKNMPKLVGGRFRTEKLIASLDAMGFARFQDQTELVLAFFRGDGDRTWVVYLSNPQWVSWIAKKKRHPLIFAAVNPTKIWRDAWLATEKNNELYLPARIEL